MSGVRSSHRKPACERQHRASHSAVRNRSARVDTNSVVSDRHRSVRRWWNCMVTRGVAFIHVRDEIGGKNSCFQRGSERQSEPFWIRSARGVLRASLPASGQELGPRFPARAWLVKARDNRGSGRQAARPRESCRDAEDVKRRFLGILSVSVTLVWPLRAAQRPSDSSGLCGWRRLVLYCILWHRPPNGYLI